MYESPITQIVSQMQAEMETELLYKVSQTVGYSIDKEELIKALKYDREQYEAGYADGLAKERWINVDDRLPKEWIAVLIYRTVGSIDMGTFAKGKWYVTYGMRKVDDVEWWQPITIPEAERGNANEQP